jgi:hypothetical protein
MKYHILIVSIFQLKLLNPTQAQNVLEQDDGILMDSHGSNRIYFHTNLSLVDKKYHPQIIENIKLGIDTTSKLVAVENVDSRVMVFQNVPFHG